MLVRTALALPRMSRVCHDTHPDFCLHVFDEFLPFKFLLLFQLPLLDLGREKAIGDILLIDLDENCSVWEKSMFPQEQGLFWIAWETVQYETCGTRGNILLFILHHVIIRAKNLKVDAFQ